MQLPRVQYYRKASSMNTPASSPLFNHGSVWKPGKRMMYNGMVKETTIANDRKQKPSNIILLSKSLTKM